VRVDVSGVNTKTFGRIFSAFWVYIALLGCAAVAKSSETPVVVPMGDNTFSITRTATNGFQRNTDKLKAEVSEDAAKYCAAQGKQLKVVSFTSEKHWIGMGYAKAKIVFKALNPGESELTSAPAAIGAGEKPLSTDDLVYDLTKLDDLRKKGILTDEEFQSEKKKVLNRSK
jgi:putative hemolysin